MSKNNTGIGCHLDFFTSHRVCSLLTIFDFYFVKLLGNNLRQSSVFVLVNPIAISDITKTKAHQMRRALVSTRLKQLLDKSCSQITIVHVCNNVYLLPRICASISTTSPQDPETLLPRILAILRHPSDTLR